MQPQLPRISGSVLVAATLGGIIWASAGNLNPPSGSVSPTMKTLTELEPRTMISRNTTPGDSASLFRITEPGSYYLTGNITGRAGLNGISVTADNVTLDLNGFALIGAPGSTSGYGILMDGRRNVEIRNGTVRDFGQSGIIEFTTFLGQSHRVINVRSIGNGVHGIILGGGGNLAKYCTVYGNAKSGLEVGSGSTIIGNTAYQNGVNGIFCGDASTVTGNTARLNGANGFSLGVHCLVDQNTAVDNDQSLTGSANISACATCTFGLNHAP